MLFCKLITGHTTAVIKLLAATYNQLIELLADDILPLEF